MRKLLIVALLLFAATTAALAQNQYYVSTSGNDANNCSVGSPCATITHVSKILTLGSSATVTTTGTRTSFLNIGAVVHVLSGTYNECVVTQQPSGYATPNGTSTKQILYVSDTQWGALIRCNNGSNGVIWQNGQSGTGAFVIHYGFDIAGNACWGIRNDGANGRHTGNKVHDVLRGGTTECSAGGAGISDNQQGNPSPNNSHDSIIDGNFIDNIGPDIAGACPNVHGIYIASENDILFNNVVSRSCGWGVQYFHFTKIGLVANNVFINNRNGGILIDASDGGQSANNYSVINNIVAHNGGNEYGIEERYGNASGTSNVYRSNLFWSNNPTSGCSNPPSGFTGCPYNFTYGARTVTGTTTAGSDSTVFVNYTGNALTGDYHLKAASPGIGAGVSGACAAGGITPCLPSNDLSGNTRPVSGAQDMGAFVFSSGAAPAVSLTPSPLAFGNVAVSASSSLTATLANTGTASLTFSAATISGTNASSFSIASTTCSSPLAQGASCTYSITATPQAAGALTANLTLNDNASGSPHQLPLTVTGGTGAATFNPTTLAFGVIAINSQSAPMTTTLTNTGSASFTVGAETITGTNAGDFPFGQVGTCTNGQTLAPGASCTASAKFIPTAAGARTANLNILTSLSGTPTVISLTGTGGAPVGSLSPSSATCPSRQIGTSGTCQAFTYSNTGNANLVVNTISITGANPTAFSQSNNCPVTIAASGSCTITTFFNPAAAGSLAATLSVTSNAASSPNTSTMTGTGLTPPTVTVAPASINFGNVRQGVASSPSGITVTNTGGVAVTISSIVTASPFFETNNCPASLGAGLNCVVNVTSIPSTTGTANGTLTITDSATGSPHTASLSVTGVKSTASLSPTSLSFGSQPVNNASAPKTIILTNTGTASLSNLGNAVLNIDEITSVWPPTGWKPVCILPSCNPGGVSPPTATSQTFNNASPSRDGKSMKVSLTGPANSNALWVYIAGQLDTATNLVADFWVQPSANSNLLGSLEYDVFNFDKTEGIEFMWGMQCNQVDGKWQVFDQLNLVWHDVAGSTCSLPAGSFHHIVQTVHRVPGDTSCSGQSCLHYDSIVVDGTPITGLPMTEPSGPVPSNFAGAVGWQAQLDIGASGSSGNPVFENIDLLNFTWSGIQFTGTNATDFTQTNSCPADLNPAATCGIAITFTPGGVGARTANLSLNTNDPTSPTTAALTGTGVATAPAVCLSTASINFGNQPVGTSSGTQPVTVTNCGTANLVISAVNSSGNFSSTGCVTTVTPGAVCVINGTFSPLAAGSLTGSFSIASNSVSSPDVVSLSGFGTQTGATLNPTSLSFGSVVQNQSKLLTMVLANTGNTTLSVLAPTITGGAASSYTGGTSCSTLAPGATCTETVTFVPQSAGSLSATFNQPFGNGVTTVTAGLSGTGVAPAPAVTLVPTSEDFGNITTGVTSAAKTVQLTNSGNAVLNITSITLTGANSADYSLTSHCGSTLAAGSPCTVDVTVTPGGTGARTANLHFIDDAADTPQNVTLTVNGVASPTPKVSLSATSLTFSPPSIQTGTTSAAQSITVTNTGNASLVVSSVTLTGTNPGDYSETNGCGTVTAGNSCAITVNFVPTAAGSRTANVSIASNAASSPDTVTLSGTGFVGTPNLVIAVSNINFGNQTVGTTSAPAAFTITNNGLATASGVSIASIGDFSTTTTCGATITAGSTCTVSVTFTPLVLCGQSDPSNPAICLSNVHTGQVSVVSNTSNSPQTVTLQGTAIPVPPPPGPIIMSMSGKFSMGGKAQIGAR